MLQGLMKMGKPAFRLYNSMSKQKEVFEPLHPPKVGMYVCGVTAYDLSHIGHARAYVAFDVLYRFLNYLGYEVNYVRNFTDVDDKIIRRANESKEEPLALSQRFCEEFGTDMASLQCLPVITEPRVSTHMNEIISMIEEIEDKGSAYVVERDVYFSVDTFPEYGLLSGRNLEDNRAGERVSVDTRKKNPADFALWKSAKPGEISWESSRWGFGRPGWHIECSAMSRKHLGTAFDIHGGGQDLIFPHHENEIAQSRAACAESTVKYWLHNGFVNVDNDKMSKSLGNYFTIRTVIEKYHPLALRYFLMTTHYRSPVNYSYDQLDHASDRLFYVYQTLADCEEALSQFREAQLSGKMKDDVQKSIKKFRAEFDSYMGDDLQTPPVLSSLVELLKHINTNASLLKARKQQQQHKVVVQNLFALETEIKVILDILGLSPYPSTLQALQELKAKALIRANLSEEEVQRRISERELARKNKDFKASDEIRTELLKKGIQLMDNTSEGTVWRPSIPIKNAEDQPSSIPIKDAKDQPSGAAT